jgi:ABC-type transporter MlaC component
MNSSLAATATFNLKTFTINATVTSNGTISPQEKVSVNYRASRIFIITPAAGYKVNDVRIDGVSIGAVSSYVFGNIIGDHAITASFSPKQ